MHHLLSGFDRRKGMCLSFSFYSVEKFGEVRTIRMEESETRFSEVNASLLCFLENGFQVR
jgi:hypothetical protein